MSGERFTLDTNVLVYAADRRAGVKHDLAVDILDRSVERDCVLTVQALGEFYAAVARKRLLAAAEAAELIRIWLRLFPTVAAGDAALLAALRDAAAWRLAFWDAMLLATAREAGCRTILSEDFQDGTTLGNVTVRNPFAGSSFPADVRDLLGLA